MALVDDVRAEIVALHDFFTGWFQGTLPQEAITQMESCLAPGFINIQPAGRVLTLAELRDSIAQGHGASSEFRIEIEDVVIRWSDGDLVLATYVEVQHGARNSTPPTNRRISTVLLERSERWIWHHVHETKLP